MLFNHSTPEADTDRELCEFMSSRSAWVVRQVVSLFQTKQDENRECCSAVVQYLPSMCKIRGLILSIPKKMCVE